MSTARATFGGGCFWCIEAPFKELAGVRAVTSGYAGGDTENPSYRAVCSGSTGHAEVVQIEYDPETVSYVDLLEVLFTVHDPTQLNRQGPDVGSQYRSAIYTHSEEQQEQAEAFIEELENEGVYDDEIVTEVEPLETFYEAEAKHQDYYERNPKQSYCTFHIPPKLDKVRHKFADRLKDQPVH
ncbi:peptide-methionine (S)-S-oxide reductase [Halohasta litchfieldiae]|jgi:peptide-methionine (S)-S-oxide reductase|uniref:Peptide methionine sulfoxide reductase MsrA n=1 Tax=Halohasta litchfieldiae TaxID=1073996 RepID=A0A1H6SDA1_9EURY|nr:peptide-methionine (S)-S-oxide reductase MsrA [Halohasta litchfieldiae]ATW87965.1 peptide-methionine (S)-S-oxide reductase [Halohasta litchfieldiae]SEI61392.1 peptide-methionine (S)-S-oxide reductase [Halohasta litchfieldiae]